MVTTMPNRDMPVQEQKKRGNESGGVAPLPYGQPFIEARGEQTSAFPLPLQKQPNIFWRPSREGRLAIRRRLHLCGYHNAKLGRVCARTKKEGMTQAVEFL